MKKILAVLLVFTLAISVMAGCGNKNFYYAETGDRSGV